MKMTATLKPCFGLGALLIALFLWASTFAPDAAQLEWSRATLLRQSPAKDHGDDDDNNNSAKIRASAVDHPMLAKMGALSKRLADASDQFWRQLNTEYGADNARNMFRVKTSSSNKSTRDNNNQTTVSAGRLLFPAPSSFLSSKAANTTSSWERLKRVLMLKILTAQLPEAIEQQQQQQQHSSFIWTTAGDSVAAGHGNLYNQSYDHVLQHKSRPLFAAVGLDFMVRPYGTGNTPSGMELGSCVKELYGSDTDVLTWGFGTTDVRRPHRPEFFLYRAGLQSTNAHLPVFLGMHATSFANVLHDMETRGHAAFVLNDTLARWLEQQAPDTAANRTQEEIAQMPSHVRAFRCGKAIEKGEPQCGDKKYTKFEEEKHPCNKRKYMADWHPGWKWHALYGNFLTLFLLEALSDALQDLHSMLSNETDVGAATHSILRRLEMISHEEREMFLRKAETGPLAKYAQSSPGMRQGLLNDIDPRILYNGDNYCHTARLPSESRYRHMLGVGDNDVGGSVQRHALTTAERFEAIDMPTELPQHNLTTGMRNDDCDTNPFARLEPYPRGIGIHCNNDNLPSKPTASGNKSATTTTIAEQPMRLAWDWRVHEHSYCGNQLLMVDHHDFFYANASAWYKMVLPPAEFLSKRSKTNAPPPPPPPLQGYIASCTTPFHWRYHTEGTKFTFNRYKSVTADQLAVTINNVAVTEFTKFDDRECVFFKHDGGHRWPANANGHFEIRVKTNDSHVFVEFSSFMIW